MNEALATKMAERISKVEDGKLRGMQGRVALILKWAYPHERDHWETVARLVDAEIGARMGVCS